MDSKAVIKWLDDEVEKQGERGPAYYARLVIERVLVNLRMQEMKAVPDEFTDEESLGESLREELGPFALDIAAKFGANREAAAAFFRSCEALVVARYLRGRVQNLIVDPLFASDVDLRLPKKLDHDVIMKIRAIGSHYTSELMARLVVDLEDAKNEFKAAMKGR